MALRHQRGERDHRRGADEAEGQRDERQLATARIDQRAVDAAPRRQGPPQRGRGRACTAAAKREDARREQIAGVEIDEAAGEFVDHGPAGVDRGDLQRGADDQITAGGTRRAALVTTKKIGSR